MKFPNNNSFACLFIAQFLIWAYFYSKDKLNENACTLIIANECTIQR